MSGLDPNFSHLAPAYLTLLIAGGQTGLPLIIVTLLVSKKVTRHPTLINFFCTWIIYSVIYCIFLYSRQEDQQPPSVLCQIQSAAIHGVPPMCVVATLALVIQLWETFREPPAQQMASPRSRWPKTLRLRIMLAMPYVTFAAFTLLTALLQRRKGVDIGSWNGLYCTIRGDTIIRYTVPAFCTVILTMIVSFEVAIAIRYFRMQRTISDSFPLAETKKSRAMVVRVLAFSLYTLVTLSAGVLFLSGSTLAWPYMVQAALPLSAFAVFGAQKDILLVWRFWKPYPTPPAFEIPVKHQPHPAWGSSLSILISGDSSVVHSHEQIPTLPTSTV